MAEVLDASGGGAFSLLSDDIVLNIFMKLEGDPRDWARLACVSARFAVLVRNVCYRVKCSHAIPSVVSDLLSGQPPSSSAALAVVAPVSELPPGGWAALHKLFICCPGPRHAGVLLENSDFGLEREIGPDENYRHVDAGDRPRRSSSSSPSYSSESTAAAPISSPPPLDSTWSLFDDLYFDMVYDPSESPSAPDPAALEAESGDPPMRVCRNFTRKRKKQCEGPVGVHLSSGGAWNLSREQGTKLLASRFRGDCLYICDWPGCVHAEEKRKYMLFRGVFKNFKRSRVWRTIIDGNRSQIGLDCAFCSCRETWDLHSAFCLRQVFGFHDDGEPVVRAYVCENGHVSGAWTERPMN